MMLLVISERVRLDKNSVPPNTTINFADFLEVGLAAGTAGGFPDNVLGFYCVHSFPRSPMDMDWANHILNCILLFFIH